MPRLSTIQTPHLTLRPLKAADAVALHRIYQTEGLLRYFPDPNPPQIKRVERFVAGQQEHWQKFGYGNWGILPVENQETQASSVVRNGIPHTDHLAGFHPAPQSMSSGRRQEIIGWAGLQFLPELNEIEVGYLLDQPFWGKGYATEAARASLRFGFEHFGFPRMIALVHPENIASRRVIEKCGMRYEKTISIWGVELMRHSVDRISFMTWNAKEIP